MGMARVNPLMGLYPTQQQRRKSKDPSALTGGLTARTSIPTNEINAPNGLTAVHPQEHHLAQRAPLSELSTQNLSQLSSE
jgi:hypothetical protein